MTELNNAVILITGAAGGFGQEFTKQLLQANSRLILTDINLKILQEKVNQIQQQVTTGEIITCIESDLTTAAGSKNLDEQVKALNIPLDILINNAGIALLGRTDEVPQEKWEQLMQVNLLAPMRLSSLFVADMIARQQGHIVNISSLAGWITPGGMTHYCTSKFGLRGFSEGLFHEVKAYNVKVTAVYPFFSRTPILESPRYGTLAQINQTLPDRLVTNPAKVIEKTLNGIKCDRLHVFPDPLAKIIYILKQYFPLLYYWVSNRLT